MQIDPFSDDDEIDEEKLKKIKKLKNQISKKR